MAELRAVCLDCGKIQLQPYSPEKAGQTIHGLCDECYQKWLERDPELTRWAFKGREE